MYDGERLQSTKLIIDSPDSEDAEESQLKMKDKMIQLNYKKLNAPYETFVPQQEIPIEQTYFSTPSTSTLPFESSIGISDLPLKKMPSENKFLQLFVKLDKSIGDLQTKIDQTVLKDRSRALIYDDQLLLLLLYLLSSSDTYVYADVRAENQDLLMTISELKAKLKLVEKEKNVNTKFDRYATLEKQCPSYLRLNLELKGNDRGACKLVGDMVVMSWSLKALDEGFSSKNYVRKFLRALHPKWRAKVMAIEESKDLSSLALDELISNLKVHVVVMEKDSKIYRGKKERVKSIALKAKKESSEDETSTSRSDDKEYVMAVRNFLKLFRRNGKFVRQPREEKKSLRPRDEKKGNSDQKCFRCGDPNHLIGDYPKPPHKKDQKSFIGGSWSDSENEVEDKTNDETCLMAQSSNEVTLHSSHYSDNAFSLDDDRFDSSKASTSETKTINFVGPSAETARDRSTIEAHGSTISRFVDLSSSEAVAEHIFSTLMSSRSDFVITRKKLIHNKIEESKKLSLNLSLKSGLGYVKIESRSKTPPPKRNNFSQQSHNIPQPRRNSRELIHQNFYPMNWSNNQC
ncbi:hypothetical protein Tco_0154006 [Tanacetum coccineum]